jgi:subtilisin family serine protease
VVNLSLGSIVGSPEELKEIENQIADLRFRRNINVVASAGNGGGGVEVPARYPGAIAVGASAADGSVCALSARGEELDLFAPGCGLAGADQSGANASFSGTSFAAPMVSATLAALRGYKSINAEDAERAVLGSGRSLEGKPTLDVETALRNAGIGVFPSEVPMTTPPAPTPQLNPIASGFVDLPTPRGSAVFSRKRRRLCLRILNTPQAASWFATVAGRHIESRRKSLCQKVRSAPGSVRVQFVSLVGTEDGASKATRLRVKRKP